MQEFLKSASDMVNSLYGLPGDIILGLFCLSLGYFLKLSPWYPNKFIPTAVMLAGLVGGPLLNLGHYDPKDSMVSQVLYHVMIGGAVSLGTWVFHAKVLKHFEKKIPFLGVLLADDPPVVAPEPKKEETNKP